MTLRKVVLPTKVDQDFAGLPADVRIYVESYLENPDTLLTMAPFHVISMLWEKAPEVGGFVGRVEGARVFFTADKATGTVTVRRIEPHSPALLR